MFTPHPFETGDSILLWKLQNHIVTENDEGARELLSEISLQKQSEKLDNLIFMFGWDESEESETEIRNIFS